MEGHSGKPLYLIENPQPFRRLGIVLYNLFHIASQKLLRIFSGIGVACIDHMERMGLGDRIHSKCTDIAFVLHHGLVQKTDTAAACNQCLDRNKAADRNFSVKITQFITGCCQPFFKNAARTGALFPDDNRFPQQVLNCDLFSA